MTGVQTCALPISNCCFLTCIQVSQEAGQVVWYSHLFQNSPQFAVIYTVNGLSVVNEVDVFPEFPCFFYDPEYAGNLISDSSAFLKSSLYIWKFLVHVLLKHSLKDFEHNLADLWNECSCTVIWTFFDIAFLRDWIDNLLLNFPNLLAKWLQHFNSISFRSEIAHLEFHHIH